MEKYKWEPDWKAEMKDDAEDFGCTVATGKTLAGIRKYANMKGITDWDHTIEEVGTELISGLTVPAVIATHKIKP